MLARRLALIICILAFLFWTTSGKIIVYAPYSPSPHPPIVTPPLVVPHNYDNLTVTISSPNNNQTYETHNVALNFTVTKPPSWDNATYNGQIEFEGLINYVSFSIDGQTTQLSTSNNDSLASTSPMNFSVNLTDLADGVHRVIVNAYGWCVFAPALFKGLYCNQIEGSSGNISFTINAPPKIHLLFPENVTYDSNCVPLIFTVDENASLVSYSLNQEANVSINGNTTLTNLTDGQQNLQVYAQAPTGSTSSIGPINFIVDLPPKIDLLFPNESSYNTTTIQVKFAIDKPVSWIAYCIDGQNNVPVSGNITLTDLSDGNHTLTIYAEDPAGNKGSSQTITFSKSPEMAYPPPPEPIMMKVNVLLSAGIAFAIAICAVFAIIEFKRKRNISPKKPTLT